MNLEQIQERALAFAEAHLRRFGRRKDVERSLAAWMNTVRMLYPGTPEVDIATIAAQASARCRRHRRSVHRAQPTQQELVRG